MKLHIGGEQVKEGWKILSPQSKEGVDFVGDMSDLSEFQTESITEIYASHVLEHVPQNDVLQTIAGIYRVLRPGGVFYVAVPDIEILAHTLISPVATPQDKIFVLKMMFGGQVDAFDYHYFGWNEMLLLDALKAAGFSGCVRVASFDLFEDTSCFQPFGFPISLNVIAKK